ncbi:MAG: DUF11 domain-containing protein, partial [Clostridia bacterium]|nr:DUF11 domain-containing protein [Clostridia bacterium]
NRRINILRPPSLGLKPTEQAVLRAKNLAGIIAYKETSAPRGVTVNPGEDVTFTYVLRNDTGASKTVEIVDSLPEGVTFKSGDAKYQDGKLTTSVTLPSHQTTRLSFTVTVNSSVKNGTVIANQLGTVGGVTLNDAPIYVAKTLSVSDRSKIDAAARKVSASNDYEMISKVYKEALGKDLPFKSANDLVSKVLVLSSDSKYFLPKEGASPDLVACNLSGGLMGGRAFGSNINQTRTRNFERKHLMTGDVILIMKDASTPQLWLCLDNGALAVVKNGAVKIIPAGTAINYIETLFGQFTFALIRPSQGM